LKEIELIKKRKPREKHFLREDGTILAKIYGSNIHYQKNGIYQEIDNTLHKENHCYCNKNNDYQVYYQDYSKKSLLTMKKDDNYIKLQLKNAQNQKAKKLKSNIEVSYKEVLDGIDIKYQTLPTKIKETIVLNKNTHSNFTFIVETNLELELKNNQIIAKNQEKEIFKIESPYMIDSKGSINENVFYKLRKKSKFYEIKLILDEAWLENKDTTFPVYVDPTITNLSQETELQDTYIYPGDNNHDKNRLPILKAGVEKVNGVDRVNRTLIKFDLPEIGTGSEIIGAYLTLFGYPTPEYTDNRTVTMHRITKDWDEQTATWDDMHDQYDEKVESIYYGGRSFAYLQDGEFIAESGMYDGNITSIVKKWYRGTPNYGLLLKDAREEYYGEYYPAFISKSYDSYHKDNTDLQPLFQLVYRNMNGLESYLDYETQNFAIGNTYVNTYTGNMTGIFELGKTIGGVFPASLNLVYNTNDVVLSKETKFGKGYKLSLDQKIQKVTISDTEYLEYHDEDGTIHYFYQKNDEENKQTAEKEKEIYNDEDGLNLTIEKTDEKCTMIDKNGGKMFFAKKGEIYRLTEIQDVKEHSVKIELDNNQNITKVIDGNQNEITITYQENNIQITSPDQTVTLVYENNVLKRIETIYGTVKFTYNTNQLIDTIEDVTGLKIAYSYYSQNPYRMKKVTQYGLNEEIGNHFELSYGFNTTKITDHKENKKTLVFNDQGNLLSINSLDQDENLGTAYAITQNYGTEENNKNKLLADAIPTRYIKNYFTNPSFERDEDLFMTPVGITKSFTEECSTTGNRSLKLVAERQGYVYYYFDVPKGKYYTLSGNFKTDTEVSISLTNFAAAEEIALEKTDEFKRESLSFYFDDSDIGRLELKIEMGKGTLYIDDLQLEEGEVANSYNIIENSDFSEGLSDWNLETWRYGEIEAPSTDEVFEVVRINNGMNTALKVKRNVLQGSKFSKIFPIKGKKGDLYNISFWFKNEGFPGDGNTVTNSVSIYFKPIGQDAEYCTLPSEEFHTDDNIWQYFTFRYAAEEDYESIRLDFINGREANDFYITNLTFYKDLANNYYEYDKEGNIIGIKDSAKDEKDAFSYDKNNQLISATTPKGKHLKVEYDNIKTDQVLSAISSMGIANQIKYDSFGNPISTKISKKANENLENGTYRIRSKGCEKYVKARYRDIVVEEDPCSNTIWKLEKQGEEEVYRIIFNLLPNYNLFYYNDKIFLGPNTTNNLFTLEQNENRSYWIKINQENKYLKAVNGKLEIVEVELQPDDPSFEFYLETTEEEFIENSATYTLDGRFVESVTDTNLHTTTYKTNSITGLTTEKKDSKGNITSYTYNNQKQITSITEGDKTVEYTYNNQNLLKTIKQDEKEYNFEYDNFLNPKTVKINNQITLVNNEYEEKNGDLSLVLYGNQHRISYDYDEFQRIKTIHKMDKDYYYRYDNNGNLAKIAESDPITTYDTTVNPVPIYTSEKKFEYDIGKRLVNYTNDHFKIHYQYDLNDNITEKKYQLNETVSNYQNIYDKDDQLTKTTFQDNKSVSYEYDELGRLIKKTINNQYPVEYDYIRNGKRTSTLIKTIKNKDDQYEYVYDELNNITKIYQNNNLLNEYKYDRYNELIEEINYPKNEKTVYTYDEYGNILTKTILDLETDIPKKADEYEYTNEYWQDQLTKYNNQSITYDEIGNPITIGSNIELSWINGRSLNSYQNSTNNVRVYYQYNEDGIRKEKIVNNQKTKYYLENNNIIFETNELGTIEYFYDLTGPIGLKYNENVYYYEKNLQGDIIKILDDNNQVVVTYEYDAWGKIISIKDNANTEITDETHIGHINPFRYRSYYYDKETGLYYLNSRYYNPTWGRFLNADGIVGANEDILSYNLYAYVSNNPINQNDYNGNFSEAAAIAGAVAAGVVYASGLLITAARALANAAWQLISFAGETVKTIHRELNKPRTEPKKNDHNVYILRDKSGKAQYVGRAKHPKETEKRHKNNDFRKDLDIYYKAKNVSWEVARGLEQALIMQCGTLKRDKKNPINNQINGMTFGSLKHQHYWDLAMTYLDENEIFCDGFE